MQMNILVAGTGYVGTTTALVLADMGWNVTGLDPDAEKIRTLLQGSIPFYEEGLEELLRKHLQQASIQFTTDASEAIRQSDAIFICVGTPPLPDGSVDMRYIRQISEEIGRHADGYRLVIVKSTVPVGTHAKVAEWIRSAQPSPHPFDVASNPEFLREGSALADSFHPDRVVIGADGEEAVQALRKLYASLNCPFVVTTPRTAEMIKYASNAFLATKISYINELARLCDSLDIDVNEIARGIGLDPRIGALFLRAGIGYGGSCSPKDIAGLLQTARENGARLGLLEEAAEINRTQYLHLLNKARARLGSFRGKTVAVLGIAFKPDTDDIREAPSLRLIRSLLSENADVRVHDPIAKLPPDLALEPLTSCGTPEEAAQGADAVFLCTEWKAYRRLDWPGIKSAMKQANLFDGRNMMNADHMKAIGFYYQGIGYR